LICCLINRTEEKGGIVIVSFKEFPDREWLTPELIAVLMESPLWETMVMVDKKELVLTVLELHQEKLVMVLQ